MVSGCGEICAKLLDLIIFSGLPLWLQIWGEKVPSESAEMRLSSVGFNQQSPEGSIHSLSYANICGLLLISFL